MQDFSVDNASMADFLAVLAKGEPLRLYQRGKQVGVVSPPEEDAEERSPQGRSPFMEWLDEWREKYQIDKYGLTDEEIEAMRDRSPGREPIDFE